MPSGKAAYIEQPASAGVASEDFLLDGSLMMTYEESLQCIQISEQNYCLRAGKDDGPLYQLPLTSSFLIK